jgi:hypothetical protein
MDMMVIGGAALVFLIVGIITGFVFKKHKRQILFYAAIGFTFGAAAGYITAPFFISFM